MDNATGERLKSSGLICLGHLDFKNPIFDKIDSPVVPLYVVALQLSKEPRDKQQQDDLIILIMYCKILFSCNIIQIEGY